MKAMIFAAGLGTRLKPLTDTMPKALVPVCGKPLLWHVMTKLKASGITDLTVNVHHFADMIVSYLESVNGLGMDVHISDERDMLLETGGGIRHAERYLSRPAGHAAGAGLDEVGHAGGRDGDSVPDGVCGDSILFRTASAGTVNEMNPVQAGSLSIMSIYFPTWISGGSSRRYGLTPWPLFW